MKRRRRLSAAATCSLEPRRLLASTANVVIAGGLLIIDGRDWTNTCTVSDTKTGAGSYVTVRINGATFSFAQSAITSRTIKFIGKQYNDKFDATKCSLSIRALGGDGNDTILGGSRNDTLVGGGGNDFMSGLGGKDVLWGDAENIFTDSDSAFVGVQGNDTLNGGDHDDTLSGGGGADSLYGGNGDDTLWGQAGQDGLWGGAGGDYLSGGWAGDYLYGEGDNDLLDGGTENDVLYGGDGADTVIGNDGDDVLFGGNGTDTVRGGNGNDFLDAGGIGEVLDGGKGLDCDASSPVINGTGYGDIFQVGSSSCWFLASLGAMASRDTLNVSPYMTYKGDGKYDVKILNHKTKKWTTQKNIVFRGAASTHRGDTQIRDNGIVADDTAMCEGEFWATVIHRGMLQYYKVDYKSESKVVNADYGNGPGEGNSAKIGLLLLGNTTATEEYKSLLNPFNLAFLDRMRGLLYRSDPRQPMVASSETNPDSKVVGEHAYHILDITTDGTVVLRNPWGTDGGATIDGVDDGVIVLSASQFANSFHAVAYTSSPVV